jgi:hypothetical protein
MEKKGNSKAAAKASAVKPVGKKPAARKTPAAALQFKVKKLPLPPPKEFDDALTPYERLKPCIGSISDEVSEVLMEAVRQSRAEGCEA